ncbi:MAG: hypothetical protein V4658_13045, partial [Bacteroidota bacterium]
MITLLILLFPLAASLLVLLSGNKLAAKVALALSVVQLAITGYAYCIFKQQGPDAFYIFHEWISSPKISFHVGVDGLGFLMIVSLVLSAALAA